MIRRGGDMRKIGSLTIVLAVSLFGCKKSETASSSTTSTQTTATTATVAPVSQTTATTASVATTPAPAAGAVATTEGEKAGARIDVTELKRTSGGNAKSPFTTTD